MNVYLITVMNVYLVHITVKCRPRFVFRLIFFFNERCRHEKRYIPSFCMWLHIGLCKGILSDGTKSSPEPLLIYRKKASCVGQKWPHLFTHRITSSGCWISKCIVYILTSHKERQKLIGLTLQASIKWKLYKQSRSLHCCIATILPNKLGYMTKSLVCSCVAEHGLSINLLIPIESVFVAWHYTRYGI